MENTAKVEIAKMRSLIERIEKPHTNYEAMLNEAQYINEAHERVLKSPEEIFDILDQIGNNKFVSIGIVTGANLNIPKVKRKNPETGRMKGYPDYDTFSKEVGSEEEIGALVKITSYNLRYYTRSGIGKKYGEYKQAANNIRIGAGLNPIADKENDYTSTMNYGGGIDMYAGNDKSKEGNFYVPQNTYGARIKGTVYAVNTEGHIIQELTPEQVKPYLMKKREMDGVAALRKMEKTEEEIEDYVQKMTDLHMNYKRFEGNSILYVVATVNGEKIIYINQNLMRNIEGIDINPQDFITIARARYADDMKTCEEMSKAEA